MVMVTITLTNTLHTAAVSPCVLVPNSENCERPRDLLVIVLPSGSGGEVHELASSVGPSSYRHRVFCLVLEPTSSVRSGTLRSAPSVFYSIRVLLLEIFFRDSLFGHSSHRPQFLDQLVMLLCSLPRSPPHCEIAL